MRDYDRYEEDLDEYEDEEGERLEGEVEEEEEEPRQPTEEELKYLELRQHLKESFRKRRKKEGGSSLSGQEKKNRLPYDNYGSFFGPSQPIISQRVIHESKSLLENQHLASKILNGQNSSKKSSSSASAGSKTGSSARTSKVNNELKTKAQKLKDTRDYSFLLSDDAEVPVPTKQPPLRNGPVPNTDRRLSRPQLKNKPSSSNGRPINGGLQDRKAVGMSSHGQAKSGPHRPTSVRPNSIGTDSRKHMVNNGSGPGRPTGQKVLPPKSTMEKKPSAPASRVSTPGLQKPTPSKLQASTSKQHFEPRKGQQELPRSKMISKPPVATSKPQLSKPVKSISSHAGEQKRIPSHPVDQRKAVPNGTVQKKVPSQLASKDPRMKKRPGRPFDDDDDDDDGGKAISMIRQMFGYNPNRYRDDDDDSDMEANFDDIMKEEKRSALIARKEDEEQLRLIQEEEERERRRKLAKKRKLMAH